MNALYEHFLNWLAQYSWLEALLGLSLLLTLAWLADLLVRRMLVRSLYKTLRTSALHKDPDLANSKVIAHLSHIVPPLIISGFVHWVPHLPKVMITVIENVCNAYMVLTLALALSALLDLLNIFYMRRPNAHLKPIKSYLQLIKIAIFAVALILTVAQLIDRSPLILLSGLGAMAAVLMLVFQDTLLSFVASMQINTNRLIRLGDWVEMGQLNADGEVIDIALHTVKIQNWDRTITSVPTKRFISDPFKNWQAMRESGGRRIKRSLYIDQTSVRFLTDADLAHLQRFRLLQGYLNDKARELSQWNAAVPEAADDPVNSRRLTNLGVYRAYAVAFLRHHSRILQDSTLMVRQMPPEPNGLPLELYCFTNTVVWTEYETVQSDIFDHLIAILPELGLKLFQNPTGADFLQLRAPQ